MCLSSDHRCHPLPWQPRVRPSARGRR